MTSRSAPSNAMPTGRLGELASRDRELGLVDLLRGSPQTAGLVGFSRKPPLDFKRRQQHKRSRNGPRWSPERSHEIGLLEKFVWEKNQLGEQKLTRNIFCRQIDRFNVGGTMKREKTPPEQPGLPRGPWLFRRGPTRALRRLSPLFLGGCRPYNSNPRPPPGPCGLVS